MKKKQVNINGRQWQPISNGVTRFLKISASVHVSVLICIIIWPSVFSHRYRHRIHPVHTVELVSPKELIPPKPAEKPKLKPEPRQTTKPKPEIKKEKSPVKKKLPVLKPDVKPLKTPGLEEKLRTKLEKLKDMEQPTVESKSVVHEEESSYTPQFKATVSSVPDFKFQWYLDFIQGKISSCWHQPQMVIDKRYSAMISFTILEDGQIRNITIKHGSGISNFDNSAKQAVIQAQPLPPLPPDYKHSQLIVNVGFNLE